MNGDLDRQLDELGPDYRALVNRMVSDCRLPSGATAVTRTAVGWPAGLLIAASLLAILGLGAVFRGEGQKRVYTVRATDPAFECLQATARHDVRLQELLHTNVAAKGCSFDRRFDIIRPLEYTLLANPLATGRQTTEEK